MRILVTGGAGFIGSHLVDRLVAEGHGVTVLDNLSTGKRVNLAPSMPLIEGDVADRALVDRLLAEADAVFHLAAIASVQVCEEEPARAAETNVQGAENIFAAAAARRIPVVYASSAAIYGDNPDLPLGENAAPRPLGNYGRHKLENERLAAQSTGITVGLRFFNVYGPRQDPRSPYSGVISKFMANARAGLPLTFNGDGEQTRDFIYVGDIVSLLARALAHADGTAIYNGCTGSGISLKQLSEAIGKAAGKPVVTAHGPAREGDIRHSLGNPQKAKAELGFTAGISLEEGLHALVAHDA